MGKETGISWTNHTFNGWWGCTKVSEGCAHCYAETFSKRYKFDIWGVGKERRTFQQKHWNEPIKWNKEAQKLGVRETVFCGSMMDWCDEEAPVDQRERLWPLIKQTPFLMWLMLTKRPELIPHYLPLDWNPLIYPNICFGTSIELDKYVNRATALCAIRNVPRFISAEPLLGPLPSLNLEGIDWLIVGGESGDNWRPMNKQWARDLKALCEKSGTVFFYKQSNGRFSGNDPWLDEKQYYAWPKRFALPLA